MCSDITKPEAFKASGQTVEKAARPQAAKLYADNDLCVVPCVYLIKPIKKLNIVTKTLETSSFKGFTLALPECHNSEYKHTPSGSIRAISQLFGQSPGLWISLF